MISASFKVVFAASRDNAIFAARNFWKALNGAVKYLLKQRHIDIELFQNKRRYIFIDLKNGLEEMLVFNLLLPEALCQQLRLLQRFL